MEFSYRDLKGSNECAFHRAHRIELGSAKDEAFELAAFEKKIIKSVLDGAMKLEDVQPQVDGKLMGSMRFRNSEQARLKAMDMIAEITRLITSIEDQAVSYGQNYTINTNPEPKDITVMMMDGTDLTVKNVRPDLVITYGNATNAVQLRTGKPKTADKKTYKMEDAEIDKQMYFLMRYAKEYAEENGNPGDGISVTGSQWFLRKETDRKSLDSKKDVGNRGRSLQFDKNLFYDENMKDTANYFNMTCGYTIGVESMSTADARMLEIMEKFADGLEKDECTKEQCKNCPYDEICHYAHAPQVLPATEKEVDLSAVRLSPVQDAVSHFDSGYAVTNAGPGSGKTFVLVLNVINLLLSGVKPEEILVIAFTRSAANVFIERIQALYDDIGTGEDISGIRIVTFNEFGNDVLIEEFQHFGFSRPPRVIQPVERLSIIEKILETHDRIPDVDYRNFALDTKNAKGPLAVAAAAFQAIKDYGYTEFDKYAIQREVGARFCSDDAAEYLAKLYVDYDAYLRERGLLEFADQEMLLLQLLEEDPYYFDRLGFKHILVDEAQDCSLRQFRILKYLTQSPSFESIMLVGDDSQSIFGFRKANPEAFMGFEAQMGLPAGTVQQFYMMDNFRSTPEILDFANKIIVHNNKRVDKTVIANKADGAAVTVKGFYSKDEEYRYIADAIKAKLDAGEKPEDIAFIAHSKTELINMASLLAEMEIETVMLNPEPLKENSRVRAGLALARCLQDSSDTKDVLTCLNAIYEGDIFTLGDEAIQTAITERREKYNDIMKMPEPDQKAAFFEELELFDENDELYQGFVDLLKSQPSLNLAYEYCANFDLYGDKEAARRECNYPGVALTTAHSSKGMEWKIVFNSLSGYDEKDLYGNTGNETEARARRYDPNSDEAEERRRLLFVSATRAKDELIVTGQYVAFGGYNDPHYNTYLREAFDAAGETWDTDAVKREMHDRAVKRSEERKKRKAEERAKIAEKAKEAVRKATEARAKAEANVGAAQ